MPLWKKLTFTTLILCILLSTFWVTTWALAKMYGIHDPSLTFEIQLPMWAPDEELGFRHKPGYRGYTGGWIPVKINAQGFRADNDVTKEPIPKRKRVLCVGDSVMWGFQVNSEQSIPGQLQQKLGEDYEVINAGVIGYSLLQEYLLLQKLQEYQPDFVIVNLCENDLLPTENHFQKLREIHIRHLDKLLDDDSIATEEREVLMEMSLVFKEADHVHSAFMAWEGYRYEILIKTLFERPLKEVIALASEEEFRLVYLLIPPIEESREYDTFASIVQEALNKMNAKTLDFQELVPETRPVYSKWSSKRSRSFLIKNFCNIMLKNARQKRHQQSTYYDNVHPTVKGYELIAQKIVDEVFSEPESRVDK